MARLQVMPALMTWRPERLWSAGVVTSMLWSLGGPASALQPCRPADERPTPRGGASLESEVNLSCHPSLDRSPAWSPDGQWIAFESDRDGNRDIYIMDSVGRRLRRLTRHEGSDRDPSWSPDGRWIAFQSDRDGNDEIYTMRADGSRLRRVTTGGASNFGPAWSPDGRAIAFTSTRDGNMELYTVRLADGTEQRLTNSETRDAYPVWSPDGTRLAFFSRRDTNDQSDDVYILDVASGVARRVTDDPAHDFAPAWSPDGRRLAFASMRAAAAAELFVIGEDGEGTQRLTINAAVDTDPAWSPDGRRIAFTAERDGNLEVVVLRVADGASPGRRNAHAMTYDAGRDRLVLFGGADETRVLGDTWEYDGSAWRRVAGEGPAARTFPSIAYDAARGRVLLFGGNRVLFGPTPRSASTLLGDLWAWDGRRWQLLATSEPNGPPPRAESVLTYDSARDRIVLFGGYTIDSDGRSRRLGDTWEWDGRAWRHLSVDGPPGRSGSAMVFDPVRRRALLFGGSTGRATDEVWEWDGERWALLTRAPGRRFNPSMVYDVHENRVLVFGGWNGSTRLADLLELRDTSWQSVAADGPSPRNHAALAYDLRRLRTVLFGGHDGDRVFGDMWTFDGVTWHEIMSVSPKARVDNGH